MTCVNGSFGEIPKQEKPIANTQYIVPLVKKEYPKCSTNMASTHRIFYLTCSPLRVCHITTCSGVIFTDNPLPPPLVYRHFCTALMLSTFHLLHKHVHTIIFEVITGQNQRFFIGENLNSAKMAVHTEGTTHTENALNVTMYA